MQKCLWLLSVKLWMQLMGETVKNPLKRACEHYKRSCATEDTTWWLCFNVQQESVYNSGSAWEFFLCWPYFVVQQRWIHRCRGTHQDTDSDQHAEQGVALIQNTATSGCFRWEDQLQYGLPSYWVEQRGFPMPKSQHCSRNCKLCLPPFHQSLLWLLYYWK